MKKQLIISIAAPLTVTTALAQSPDQTLSETVVTASRIATPLIQVGSSISIITGEELEQRQIRLVSDALRSIPGVAVNRSGGPGTLSRVRIRGAEENHTLVLIDGIEANDIAFGSSFDFAHLLTSDIERIEVLRGAQSALWGSDAIGGVINIITKKGKGPTKISAELEGGSFGSGQLNANLSGGSERYHFSLGATGFHTDGTSVAPGGQEDDGYDNTTLSLKTGIIPRDNLNIDLVARYTSATTQFDPQDFAFPPTATFGQVIDGDDESDNEQIYGRLQATLELLDGNWTHRIGTAISDTENEFFRDGLKTNSTDGRKLKYDYQTDFSFDTPDFAAAHHTLTLAVEREEEDFVQRGATLDAPRNQDQDLSNTSVVGEYRLDLWDQLFLSSAVRHDNNDRFDDATTYRLTGAYVHPDTEIRLHSSYGTGVTNPSFTELFGFFPGTFVGNPDLKPEESESWDIGVEFPLLNNRASLDITYFHNDLEDEILPTFDSQTFLSSVENDQGRSRRQGVEIAGRAKLSENLNLTGAYTYTDSEDPDGQQEARRPRHTASLNLNYGFLQQRAQLNLGVTYNGDQEDFDFTTIPSGRVTLDSYTLVNLGASYRFNDQLTFFGRVENLLDDSYQDVFGFDTPGIGAFVGLKAEL